MLFVSIVKATQKRVLRKLSRVYQLYNYVQFAEIECQQFFLHWHTYK